MLEQRNIPSEDEYKALDLLFDRATESKKVRLFLRRMFINFIEPDEIRTDTLTRLMKRPSILSDRRLVAAAYDFALLRMGDAIEDCNAADRAKKDEVKLQIENLVVLRAQRLQGTNNLASDLEASLTIGHHLQPITPELTGKYFGYRRSANAEEIVRFTINITKLSTRQAVGFTNEYMRDGHWLVQGTGYQLMNTLYLSGHAQEITEQTASHARSLGLRFFALRPLPNTDCLHGLLISMANTPDGAMPIAARILLVPRIKHRFSPALGRQPGEDTKSWERRIISSSPKYDPDVRDQIGWIFKDMRDDYFLELIRNGTTSVLRASPSESTSLARLEEAIRNIYTTMDQGSMQESMFLRYEQFLEQTRRELETRPGGSSASVARPTGRQAKRRVFGP